MSDTFNMRNPEEGEIQELHQKAKLLRAQRIKYKMLKDLLDGKTVDMTQNTQLFEALNREKMEFEQLLTIHKNDQNVIDCLEQAKEDRGRYDDGKYWNPHSKSKIGMLGHIPDCIYYSRPNEYWNDEKILKSFFNMFPKFRISTKEI